jgi:hypothetical protein
MEQINQLLEALKTHDLNHTCSQSWIDRASGTLRARATFENGSKFELDIADKSQIPVVQSLFQENLKRVFSRVSEFRDLMTLQAQKKYTLIVNSELGFGVSAIQFTMHTVQVGRYAQYDNCIEIIFTPKRKRNLHSIKFYGKKDFALFEGWVEVDTNMFAEPEDQGIIVVRKAKYPSFDDRFMDDAIASVKVAPLFIKRFKDS